MGSTAPPPGPPPGPPGPPPLSPPPVAPPPAWQPPQGPTSQPAEMVNAPAIALMIVFGISAFMALLGIVFQILGIGLGGLSSLSELGIDDQKMLAPFVSGAVGIVTGLIQMLLNAVVIYGAIQMRQLRSYGLAMAASIIAIIPCIGPCCIVGIPFGIWALVILLKPEVKEAFT